MKTVLITGANKGIGYEVARQLAGKGFEVFVGARNRGAGERAVSEITKRGGNAIFLEIDVADEASVTAAARDFLKHADHLDVLINNAGIIADGDDAILQISDELIRKTLETNTLGALRVTRAFVPVLGKSKTPRIINVSSGGGQLTGGADGWSPAYCISKTALNGVTSQLAAALPKFAVNSVCPGWVRTDMGGQNASRSVEEGADTIVWLAADAPQKLTGKFLRDRKEIDW
ncbi:MAG TPA: SDR family NAD(P)-dependent oxidoreductase [Candidatus Udaeobacter sp.]|jgi:NAD(P)-dependent dehydrogenase (short-subunit alcohol dehydrogenase family)|nr:SDR family NAD(P)-dependent oxidoreductase [Candidatus Udaeobacter sp.]